MIVSLSYFQFYDIGCCTIKYFMVQYWNSAEKCKRIISWTSISSDSQVTCSTMSVLSPAILYYFKYVACFFANASTLFFLQVALGVFLATTIAVVKMCATERANMAVVTWLYLSTNGLTISTILIFKWWSTMARMISIYFLPQTSLHCIAGVNVANIVNINF